MSAQLGAQRSGSPIAPERIFAAIGAREGSTVCEIGAGDGELSLAAARAVGSSGRIYTSELGTDRVARLKEKVRASGLPQIAVVAGDPLATNFPDGACDAIFMRDVYHHFSDPAAMDASISKSLKPGGRVAILDFTPPGQEAPRPADRDKDGMHGVTADTVLREMKDAGFEPGPSEIGDRWFMVVVLKPNDGASRTSGLRQPPRAS